MLWNDIWCHHCVWWIFYEHFAHWHSQVKEEEKEEKKPKVNWRKGPSRSETEGVEGIEISTRKQ